MTASFNAKAMHREAMRYAQEALVAQKEGKQDQALLLYEKAFALEKQVALGFLNEDTEPTRSILFRSAASLAKNLGKYREAEQLVAYGLAGNPPDEIADELRNLYEDINLYRHLDLKEPLHHARELQLSSSTEFVGFLRFADATRNQIQITSNSGKSQKITVPSGLADIVKIYWDDEVRVKFVQQGKKIVLNDIEKVY